MLSVSRQTRETECPLPCPPICVAVGTRTLFSTKSGWVEKERERNSSDYATVYLLHPRLDNHLKSRAAGSSAKSICPGDSIAY